DRIGGDGAQRREAHGRRDQPDHCVGRAPAHAGHHALDTFQCRRNDGQTVCPALLIEVVVGRLDGVRDIGSIELRFLNNVEHVMSLRRTDVVSWRNVLPHTRATACSGSGNFLARYSLQTFAAGVVSNRTTSAAASTPFWAMRRTSASPIGCGSITI